MEIIEMHLLWWEKIGSSVLSSDNSLDPCEVFHLTCALVFS